MSKVKRYEFFGNIGEYSIEIFVGDNINEIADEYGKVYKVEQSDIDRLKFNEASVIHLENKQIHQDKVVGLIPKNIKDSTVWHESLHLAWYYLDILGVDVDYENHEVLAYTQEHVAKNIFECIAKYKKATTKKRKTK